MNRATVDYVEVPAKATSGMLVLILNSLLIIAGIVLFIVGVQSAASKGGIGAVVLIVAGALYAFLVGPLMYAGLKILKPNEAYVLTLFGRYYGTLRGDGFFFVNPFCSALNPATKNSTSGKFADTTPVTSLAQLNSMQLPNKKISLKALTLNNEKQKINDKMGNPIIIGIVVIWKVANTAKAVFAVDNYTEYLSIQCDSALRNIVSQFAYDSEDNENSLRGSSQFVADRLRDAIQEKVDMAGLEIVEARITHLAYAPEIAAAMLQRQQASAIIDARQMIVEGAVGMVEMALSKLGENNIVSLDEERKAAMVSNLLVVLCGNRDAQPIVNSGSLY